ncbi:hypothetical protein EON63_06570 [archaeon]|nr:MAG: hypothetical protein EON63_06570 [archaeon]
MCIYEAGSMVWYGMTCNANTIVHTSCMQYRFLLFKYLTFTLTSNTTQTHHTHTHTSYILHIDYKL